MVKEQDQIQDQLLLVVQEAEDLTIHQQVLQEIHHQLVLHKDLQVEQEILQQQEDVV